MNKLIFKKILNDYLIFFSITLISASLVVWIFQAVNFLDIMIEDGRGYVTYLYYSLLNFPKIISRLLPFVCFFSFFYILNKYETTNELLIFWNFGINKIKLVHFFFYISCAIMLIQILFTSIIVPNSLQFSRFVMKNSDVNLFEGFIKPKKFNDTVKNLTIYSDDKTEDGDLINIFIKKDTGPNSYQITHAKVGKLKIGLNNFLELYNGQTINNIDGKIAKFKFQQSDFALNNLQSDVIEVNKIQETTTFALFSCLNKLYALNINFFNQIDFSSSSHNCRKNNLSTIYKELYKRFVIPFYIPVIILITLVLLLKSKEEKNFLKLKYFIFVLNFFIIIFSESITKIVDDTLNKNFLLIILPIILILMLILNFNYQFKTRYKTN